MNRYLLPESEEAILNCLWEHGESMTAGELLSYFRDSRNWKKQTLNTLLFRLKEKQMLNMMPKGRKNGYYPPMEKTAYEQKKAEAILERSYEGSLKNFLAAFTGGKKLSGEDAEELKELIDSLY